MTESIVSNKHVNAHNALTKFSEWVKKKTDLPSNDHVMLLTRQVFSYNNVILYKTLLHTPHSYNNHVNTHNALTKFSEWVKKKTTILSVHREDDRL
jgi:hypothetical protein